MGKRRDRRIEKDGVADGAEVWEGWRETVIRDEGMEVIGGWECVLR